jgi:hypothetical protein
MNQIKYRICCRDWILDLAKEKSGVESRLLAGFGKKLNVAG